MIPKPSPPHTHKHGNKQVLMDGAETQRETETMMDESDNRDRDKDRDCSSHKSCSPNSSSLTPFRGVPALLNLGYWSPASIIFLRRSDLVSGHYWGFQVLGVNMEGKIWGSLVTATKPGLSLPIQEGQRDTDTKKAVTESEFALATDMWAEVSLLGDSPCSFPCCGRKWDSVER